MPVWYGKPIAGVFVRLYQVLARKLKFNLTLVLTFNGIYNPNNNSFSPGYRKQISIFLKSLVQKSSGGSKNV